MFCYLKFQISEVDGKHFIGNLFSKLISFVSVCLFFWLRRSITRKALYIWPLRLPSIRVGLPFRAVIFDQPTLHVSYRWFVYAKKTRKLAIAYLP